jgi:hypothetical protein
MQVNQILSQLPDSSVQQLAADKAERAVDVHLPRSALEKDIASALSSFSYVADVLAASRPPTYAFLKLLMESADGAVPIEGFAEAVNARTDATTEWVTAGEDLPPDRDYKLYRAMLAAAWQSEAHVDESEARLLAALREALGLTMREHLLLEHHAEVRPAWDTTEAYENARNHLLARGLVLLLNEQYVLPDEVRLQVRRYWDMELHDADYRRLLEDLTGEDLRLILEKAGLRLSGSKAGRIDRIVEGLIAPSFALDCLHTEQLRELSRERRLTVALPKAESIAQLINYYDRPDGRDEAGDDSGVGAPSRIQGSGERELPDHAFRRLFMKFSGHDLYEMLGAAQLPRAGAKAERVERLLTSGYDERWLMRGLRGRELRRVCEKLGLKTSGPKDELIDRLLAEPPRDIEAEADALGAAQVSTAPNVGIPSTDSLASPETTQVSTQRREPISTTSAPPPEIPGLPAIKTRYSSLPADEQMVLALLHDAGSLNEADLHRAISRHDLGWWFASAHMAELLQKLDALDNKPVRVLTRGGAIVYEWVGAERAGQSGIGRWPARDVIDALRDGVVPERHLERLAVGQEAPRAHLREQLDYVATGRSTFKFLRGAYGSGKSFTTAWLREWALSEGFAVSSVRVSAERSLDDLPSFYSGLLEGLRTPEKRGTSSFTDVLEAWFLALQRKTERIEGLVAANVQQRPALVTRLRERLENELESVASHDPALPPALRAFFEARVAGHHDLAMQAAAWIGGAASLSNQALRTIGVKGVLEADQVLARLHALLEMIRSTPLKGLVVLVDELELVRRRPHQRSRDQAYETLRALVDEAGENRLPGCLMVFTGTSEFFTDRRHGLASYEALAERIKAPDNLSAHQSMRQPVISLEGLDGVRLRDVARRTRALHGEAFGWPAESRVTDAEVDELVEKWVAFGGDSIDRLPRPFLRQLVHVLDLCEEHPELSARECFLDPERDPEARSAMYGPRTAS